MQKGVTWMAACCLEICCLRVVATDFESQDQVNALMQESAATLVICLVQLVCSRQRRPLLETEVYETQGSGEAPCPGASACSLKARVPLLGWAA